MRWMKWMLVVALLMLLTGCSDKQQAVNGVLNNIEQGGQVETIIPAEIVNLYGTLNMEAKVATFQSEDQSNGAVTVLLDKQDIEAISQSALKMLNEFAKAIASENGHAFITDVSFKDSYSQMKFFVTNTDVLQEENFLLTEEMLVKSALAYQIVNDIDPNVIIRYIDPNTDALIAEKKVPDNFVGKK